MFLTFSCIFSASKQIYHQLQQNPNSSKPKFSIPNKKKIIKSEINPKSNSKRIGDEIDPEDDRPASRSAIRWDDLEGTIWVCDLRNGFDGWARRSDEWVRDLTIGFDGRARQSEEWVCDLTIGALLDERARSWVFWVRRSSWIDLAFACAGCWCDLSSVLSLSLSLSLALSLFCAWPGNGLKVKWFCKMIFGSNEANFGQTEMVFRKFYFL